MAGRRKLGDRRARRDAMYQRAKQSGYAARAVFKLEELDKKFKLLAPGRRVLDLGCWPGSWMQYAAERVGPEGLVVGIDLREVELGLPPWTHTLVGDVEALDPAVLIDRFGAFDAVVSDMAPHTTGDQTGDRMRSEELTRVALALACQVLRPGGHFAAKVFQGGGFRGLMNSVRAEFSQSRAFHTAATRSGSAEAYLVGQGLQRRPVKDTPR